MKPIKRILTALYFIVATLSLSPVFALIAIFRGLEKASKFMDEAVLLPLIRWWK